MYKLEVDEKFLKKIQITLWPGEEKDGTIHQW